MGTPGPSPRPWCFGSSRKWWLFNSGGAKIFVGIAPRAVPVAQTLVSCLVMVKTTNVMMSTTAAFGRCKGFRRTKHIRIVNLFHHFLVTLRSQFCCSLLLSTSVDVYKLCAYSGYVDYLIKDPLPPLTQYW